MDMDYEACPNEVYGHDANYYDTATDDAAYDSTELQSMYKMDPCTCQCMQEDLCPGLPLAQAYVRPQAYSRTFAPSEALKCGTLFPELVSPYK